MKIAPFLLDHWLNQEFTYPIEYDLGGSTGPKWTLQDLLQLFDPEQQQQVFRTTLSYSDAAGSRILREAIAKLSGSHPEDVQILTGAAEGLLILLFLASEPGANIVLPFPLFPPVMEVAASLGLEIRSYYLRPENQFRIEHDEIKKLTDRNTRMIFINSPHNPTGAVIRHEELSDIHDFAVERGVQLVVDEVYHPLYHGVPEPSAARLPHATVISDFSKALCLSGLRIGWIVDRNHERLEKYLNARCYFTVSNSPLSELLAAFALQESEKIYARLKETVSKNLTLLDAFFAENRDFVRWIRPQGGTVSLPWLVSSDDARLLCEAVLRRGIMLVPGDCFGMSRHFRLGFGACSKDISPALQTICNLLPS